MTLPFHLAMAPVTVALLGLLWQRPGVGRAVVVLAAQQAIACLLAFALREDFFGFLRLLCWGLFAHGTIALTGSAILLRRNSRTMALLLGLAAAANVAIAFDAFYVEPRALEVSRHRLRSAKVTRPLRVVALADTQTDRIDEHQHRAFRLALEQRPDLIVLLGDYVQIRDRERRVAVLRDLRQYLKSIEFSAPMGVVAVRGNVDHRDWVEAFRELPVTAISRSTRLTLGEVDIDALSMGDSFSPDLHLQPAQRFHLALGHSPDFALGDNDADLLLAGHCHGGQVRLPFLGPLVTFSRVPRAWTSGLTWLDHGRALIISRGIGLERVNAPRMRFLCRPEIVVIDVVPDTGAEPAAGTGETGGRRL